MKIRSPVLICPVLFGPKWLNHEPAEELVYPTGKVNFIEPAPEALVVVSMVGTFGLLPFAMIPKSLPQLSWPRGLLRGIEAAVSKLWQRSTPGAAQRAAKSASAVRASAAGTTTWATSSTNATIRTGMVEPPRGPR